MRPDAEIAGDQHREQPHLLGGEVATGEMVQLEGFGCLYPILGPGLTPVAGLQTDDVAVGAVVDKHLAAPQVSAVIATRDRPGSVTEAIASAIAQTYRPLDVWVVDDGSWPPLSLPAHLRCDERVHLLRHETPRGAGAARNLAVERCASTLLAFLDDDDVWLPEKTAHQVQVLTAAGGGVAAVDGGFELCRDQRILRRHTPPTARDLRRELLRRPCLTTSAVLVRRSAFEAAGGFRTDIERTEDWDLWLRLADQFAIATVPEVVVRRQQSEIPPAVLLNGYRQILAVLAPRVAALPPDERVAVEAWHLMVEGVYQAQAGQRGPARRMLWQAWRRDRRRIWPLVQLGRTIVGERQWQAAAGLARLARS